jgi:hypothetical protein
MLPLLREYLLAHWSELPVNQRRPDTLSFLGTRTPVYDGYALFLAFSSGDRHPSFAVKIARTPAAEVRLRHEYEVLKDRQIDVSFSLPCPVMCESIGGFQSLVTTVPQGRPLTVAGERPARCFEIVTECLVSLAGATRTSVSVDSLREDLLNMSGRFVEVFKPSTEERATLEAWVHEFLGFSQRCLVAAHGNVCRQNVWWGRGRAALVNWEWSAPAALPFHDFFTFATTFDFPPTPRRPLEDYIRAFHMTYSEKGRRNAVMAHALERYRETLGIPHESLESCFGIYLTHAALREYDRLEDAAALGYLPLVKRTVRLPYRHAIRDQIWISLLRLAMSRRHRLRFGY